MKRRILLAAALVVLGALAGTATRFVLSRDASAAPDSPDGFASPINGGCYIAAENSCKIHIDPFTININEGAAAKLELFRLLANGQPIYDFATDLANPPYLDYAPSPVMLDFAAECGQAYNVYLVAKDSSDTFPLFYGKTGEFVCPAAVPTEN